MSKTISIEWSVEDVFKCANERDITITEAQAERVLDLILKNHDANIGINWDIINFTIDDVIKG